MMQIIKLHLRNLDKKLQMFIKEAKNSMIFLKNVIYDTTEMNKLNLVNKDILNFVWNNLY